MNIDCPPWVSHGEQSVYSLDINYEGKRIATAGSDAKVKIWSLIPILSGQAEDQEERFPKILATISEHTAPVNTVRFSSNGRFLATCSDDQLAFILELRSGPAKTIFGTAPSLENWSITATLRGHNNNVVDIAWSPDDTRLATCSLDNSVSIWNSNGRQAAVLEGHSSYVKGIAWDPVGSYLASQSDDKSVIIWRCSDWTQITRITAPFQQGMHTQTFSLRICWTTDGLNLMVPNCYQSPSHTAAVMDRGKWDSSLNIVGHMGIVTVIRASPLLYKGPDGSADPICIFAMGAQDSKVTVWRTAQHRPCVIVSKVFKQTVTDLAWSSDGQTLLACSTDGRVAVIRFEEQALGEPMSAAETQAYLEQQYGQKPGSTVLLPETAAQLGLEKTKTSKAGAVSVPGPPVPSSRLVPKPGANLAGCSTKGVSARMGGPDRAADGTPDKAEFPIVKLSKVAAHGEKAGSAAGQKRALERQPAARATKVPRRISADGISEAHNKTPIAQAALHQTPQGAVSPYRGLSSPRPVPKSFSVNLGKEEVPSGPALEFRLEIANANNSAQVSGLRSGTPVWKDTLGSPAISAAGNSQFSAVALRDGTLLVYTPSGRRFLPSFWLSSPAAFLRSGPGHELLAVLQDGTVKLWDLQREELVVSTTLPPSRGAEVVQAQLTKAGSPLVVLNNGTVHALHLALQSWLCIVDPANLSSPFTSSMNDSGAWELSAVEKQAAEARGGAAPLGKTSSIDNRRHLETRLAAAELLQSPAEYRRWLLTYVRHLSGGEEDAGLREVCKDLLGPIRRPRGASAWRSEVLGLDKHALLGEVLKEVARHRKHQRLVNDFTEYLHAAEEVV